MNVFILLVIMVSFAGCKPQRAQDLGVSIDGDKNATTYFTKDVQSNYLVSDTIHHVLRFSCNNLSCAVSGVIVGRNPDVQYNERQAVDFTIAKQGGVYVGLTPNLCGITYEVTFSPDIKEIEFYRADFGQIRTYAEFFDNFQAQVDTASHIATGCVYVH